MSTNQPIGYYAIVEKEDEFVRLVREKVCDILADCFKGSGANKTVISNCDLINDLGLDSVTFIYLIVSLEDQFELVFADDFISIEYFRNVDLIVDIILKHIKKNN